MIWNLDKYEGLAKTEYILDASAIDSTWLTGKTTVVGSGTVVRPEALNSPGGEIQLGIGATAGSATLTLPLSIGRTSGSLVAVAVEVLGLKYVGIRPTFRVELVSGAKRQGILLDEIGGHLALDLGSGSFELTTAMRGNMTDAKNGAVGFLADFSAQTIRGHVGYSSVEKSFSFPGLHQIRLVNESKDSPNYKNHTASFRQVRVLCVWGIPGETIRKVY